MALTVGVQTVLESREVVVVVTGQRKALALPRSATTGAGALLLLLGSLGLMVHAHEAIPELPALTALCGALAAQHRRGTRR